MRKKLSVLLGSLLIGTTIAFANVDEKCKPYKNFYNDHYRGWFYKEVCIDQKKKKEKKKEENKTVEYHILKEKEVKIPWNIIDNLDPDDIYKIYKRARKIAVMYPTDHNVKEFQKLNIWLMNKSEKFADTFIKLVRTDTYLSRYASSVPASTVARDVFLKTAGSFKERILNEYKDKAGLVVVVEPGCSYCEAQKRILKFFSLSTGWKYKLVNINDVPNMVKKFGIARVPDIFLVLNKNGRAKWIRIGSGLHSESELEDIVVYGLYLLGEIKDDNKAYIPY